MLKKCVGACFLSALLQITGLILFVLGFFPVKPTLRGMSGIESFESTCAENPEHVSPSGNIHQFKEKLGIGPQYARVVLMVIDGFPAEFLLGKGDSPIRKEMMEAMHFTQSLLTTRKAIGFHARAAPPTVTMPRLKAMTSGAIAGFLDVAFNFNTQAMIGDSLIGQLERLGWRMVMYGDETWLRLFPHSFIRHDGVSSFYVKDTIQVDYNVTRHLDMELKCPDWELLVLHYLGLDHVGHLGGRSSPLMVSKLQEMDAVIQNLYASLIQDKDKEETLLIVVSDHGMTHGGNHGGASFEETDALALFIRGREFLKSTHFENRSQVDVVPTLALLLGIPIPKNSVGALLPELFDTFTGEKKLRALEVNAWQLLRLLKVRSPKSPCLSAICSDKNASEVSHENIDDRDIAKLCYLFKIAQEGHKRLTAYLCERDELNCSSVDLERVAEAYLTFLRATSDWLAKGTTEKRKLLVFSGGVLMLISSAIFVGISLGINKETNGRLGLRNSELENFFALAGICGHALSLNSSSLVEEEQFTLYFLVVTLWFFFLRKACQHANFFEASTLCQSFLDTWNMLPNPLCLDKDDNGGRKLAQAENLCSMNNKKLKAQIVAIFMVLVTAKIVRSWHRSGVNWAHLADVAKWLEQVDGLILFGTHLLSLSAVLAICCWLVLEQTPRNLMQKAVACSLTLSALLISAYIVRTKGIKLGHVDNLSTKLAQLAYIILGSTSFSAIVFTPWLLSFLRRDFRKDDHRDRVPTVKFRESLNFIGKVVISCWCLLQLLLQQPVNSVLMVILIFQLICCLIFFNLAGPTYSLWLKVLALYWMGGAGHFGMGNTNTLATVDVAGAYIGLSQHSIFFTGMLAFIITYAVPLLYMMGIFLIVSFTNDANDENNTPRQHWLLEAFVLPSNVLLALSSIILLVFSAVMVQMQGHLFIWSVFSPKYIYVCFTILSTYVGVLSNAFTSLYTFLIVNKFAR